MRADPGRAGEFFAAGHIVLSSRYAPSLCVLLVLALVPTVMHTYFPPAGDSYSAAAIPAELDGFLGLPGDGRTGAWEREFGSTDWIDRRYVRDAEEVSLAVLRSFDAKRLYHHPELMLAYGVSFDRPMTTRLSARPDLPVHLLSGRQAVALYALHHGDTFVENPVWFQLRSSLALLVSRRTPMTLFFARQPADGAQVDVDALPAAAVLLAAVDAFESQPAVAGRIQSGTSPSRPARTSAAREPHEPPMPAR